MMDIFSLWHNAGNATKNSESKKNLKNVNILFIIVNNIKGTTSICCSKTTKIKNKGHRKITKIKGNTVDSNLFIKHVH